MAEGLVEGGLRIPLKVRDEDKVVIGDEPKQFNILTIWPD